MRFLLLLLFFLPLAAFSQTGKPVLIMDFVQVKDNRFDETLHYYRQNWMAYRKVALEKGFITGYRIVQTKRDSLADFDLVLITEYADSLQHSQSEKNFETIIRQLRPNGPVLLNNAKPNDFRRNLFFREATQLESNTTTATRAPVKDRP